MAIQGLPLQAKGKSIALIICDDCGQSEEVPCAYRGKVDRRTKTARPNDGQARARALDVGWSVVRNKMRCPNCEEKRKAQPMPITKEASAKPPPAKPQAARTPSKRERIEIFALLADVYDIDAGRYRNAETDDSVADVLGVMPGWVAEIREAEFGPDGSNDEIAKLSEAFEQSRKAFRDLLSQIEAIGDEFTRIKTETKAQKERLDSATAKLGAIKSALSPRINKAPGVK